MYPSFEISPQRAKAIHHERKPRWSDDLFVTSSMGVGFARGQGRLTTGQVFDCNGFARVFGAPTRAANDIHGRQIVLSFAARRCSPSFPNLGRFFFWTFGISLRSHFPCFPPAIL